MTEQEPGGWGAPLYEAVLDATGTGPGTTVLDLGCGTGLFARVATDRGARVTGVDLDDDAVAQAAAAVPEATFLVRNAQDPPRGPFDVVAAVQLLMHVRDPIAVLRRAGRVGGLVAATVWGREHECDLRVFEEAFAPWAGPRQPSRASSVSEPARLRSAAERAGLVVERLDEVAVPFDYPDDAAVFGALMATPLARVVSQRTDPGTLRAAVLDHLDPYRTADGGYRLQNLVRLLVMHPR